MSALLLSGIQAQFGAIFGALYLDGTITRVTLADDGDGGLLETSSDFPCKVQQDACTERQRLEQGYSPRDVRLLILQSGQGAVYTNDRVTVLGIIYALGPTITQDPARSYWECRGIFYENASGLPNGQLFVVDGNRRQIIDANGDIVVSEAS